MRCIDVTDAELKIDGVVLSAEDCADILSKKYQNNIEWAYRRLTRSRNEALDGWADEMARDKKYIGGESSGSVGEGGATGDVS